MSGLSLNTARHLFPTHANFKPLLSLIFTPAFIPPLYCSHSLIFALYAILSL
nr:MAG TPA: hypothetical protein [Caudoviricetes sp.]